MSDLEKVAMWMIEHSIPTGHGDTLNDLLVELRGHTREAALREAANLIRTEWLAGTDVVAAVLALIEKDKS